MDGVLSHDSSRTTRTGLRVLSSRYGVPAYAREGRTHRPAVPEAFHIGSGALPAATPPRTGRAHVTGPLDNLAFDSLTPLETGSPPPRQYDLECRDGRRQESHFEVLDGAFVPTSAVAPPPRQYDLECRDGRRQVSHFEVLDGAIVPSVGYTRSPLPPFAGPPGRHPSGNMNAGFVPSAECTSPTSPGRHAPNRHPEALSDSLVPLMHEPHRGRGGAHARPSSLAARGGQLVGGEARNSYRRTELSIREGVRGTAGWF